MSVRLIDVGDGMELTLTDDLRDPRYSWPPSRVSIPIAFGDGPHGTDDVSLYASETGEPIAFQLTDTESVDGRLVQARLHMVTDLPSGAVRRFKLDWSRSASAAAPTDGVSVRREGELMVLGNGLVRVALPAADMTSDSSGGVSAPIQRFGDGSRWLGRSRFSGTAEPIRCHIEWPTVGPVVSEGVLVYEFSGGRCYRIVVRLCAGMEFVEVDEHIEGFTRADDAALVLEFDGIDLTHQYCANRPAGLSYDAYSDVPWEQLGTESDVNGRLPMKLAPFHNWLTYWRLPAAAFWNDRTNTTVGVFITDVERWDDREYAIWNSADTLCVRFFADAARVRWRYPLAAGTRSTAITAYPHTKDVDVVNRTGIALAHVDTLRRWHGWLTLDKVKDWVLDHVEPAETYPRFFTTEYHDVSSTGREPLELLHRVVAEESSTIDTIPNGGERSNHGPGPGREVYQHLVPLFDEVAGMLSEPERRDIGAVFQFLAYVYDDEALMPTRRMLAGHPNFLTDAQGVVAQLPFLFPNHPAAARMADRYERNLALNVKYHSRPDIPAWGAIGGRWTENLACYVWGPIDLMVIYSHLLRVYFDGRNRLARPETSAIAYWVLNTLSAPLQRCDGLRTLPAQGAHAHGRQPARSLRVLGQELVHTEPLLAEHLLWAAPPGSEDRERPPVESYDYWTHLQSGPWHDNTGTDPELQSAKFTGYGFVLRAGVGTPEEVTVYLQQIDAGPNYRWGRAGRGGNGVIYYYAAGRRYSHNAGEDVGDDATGDVERCTNFGVRKDPVGYKELGPYRSVGMNDLTEPLFNFGFAQYAQVNAAATATPEYRSRSILLSGTDYIVVYDDVVDNAHGRFSWFVDDDGDFPLITQLTPGVAPVLVGPQAPPENHSYSHPWIWTKGRHYDGAGAFLTVVSHHPELSVLAVAGGCLVRRGTREDRVFRSSQTQDYTGADGVTFRGTAGIIRRHDSAPYEAALFTGDRIGIRGITIDTDGDAGVSVTGSTRSFTGTIMAPNPTRVTITAPAVTAAFTFYLDGAEIASPTQDHRIVIDVPTGTHHWQWTVGLPTPGRARVLRTNNGPGTFTLVWGPVPGAVGYHLQVSHDGGHEWETIITGVQDTEYVVEDIEPGVKIHVRVIAQGGATDGRPSRPYPVYVSTDPPHHPDGLLLRRSLSGIEATWGEILGAAEYCLYRRAHADQKFVCIYRGTERTHLDTSSTNEDITEYRVAAINGNGESAPSPIVDSDPARTIDWDPRPDEVFRRSTESGEFYADYDPVVEEAMPTLTYPNPERRPWRHDQ